MLFATGSALLWVLNLSCSQHFYQLVLCHHWTFLLPLVCTYSLKLLLESCLNLELPFHVYDSPQIIGIDISQSLPYVLLVNHWIHWLVCEWLLGVHIYALDAWDIITEHVSAWVHYA